MDALWGHGDHIQVLHPATQCIAGREGVRASTVYATGLLGQDAMKLILSWWIKLLFWADLKQYDEALLGHERQPREGNAIKLLSQPLQLEPIGD